MTVPLRRLTRRLGKHVLALCLVTLVVSIAKIAYDLHHHHHNRQHPINHHRHHHPASSSSWLTRNGNPYRRPVATASGVVPGSNLSRLSVGGGRDDGPAADASLSLSFFPPPSSSSSSSSGGRHRQYKESHLAQRAAAGDRKIDKGHSLYVLNVRRGHYADAAIPSTPILGTPGPTPAATLIATVTSKTSPVESAFAKSARVVLPAPASPRISSSSFLLTHGNNNDRSSLLPRLVIVVCSKPENTELRMAIRKTWGYELNAQFRNTVLLRFFVGLDEGWDEIVEREKTLHDDVIILSEYMDSYENLSYKVLAALSWALRNVRTARFIMKADDDTYVNLPYLLHELLSGGFNAYVNHGGDAALAAVQKGLFVMGAVCVDSPVVRDDGDKWFVSHLDYPSDVYPTYVFGGAYVMTRSAADAILQASLKADYLHLEDVLVTGILAREAGVEHVSHPGFAFWTSKRPSPCDMVTGRRMNAVNMTSKQFYVMYSGIHAILRTGNWTRC